MTPTRLPAGLLFFVLSFSIQAAGLNDTGQTACYDGSSLVACADANSGDTAAYPRQDGRFGRDRAGMAKVGGGAAGFDFTRVCMSGELAGQGDCPANPVQGTGANQWACTKDNHTNLIWSLDSPGYTWANAITYRTEVNASNRCGYSSGWRLPTRRELLSIVHNGTSSPAIDSAYFPGTTYGLYHYWSSDTYAPLGSSYVWLVNFANGGYAYSLKGSSPHYVRFVRSGE